MAKILKLNQALTFGKIGSIQDYEPFGFELSEAGQSWTVQGMAGFTFAADAVAADPNLKIRLVVTPFLYDDRILQQQLYVYINGLLAGYAALTGHETLEFPIPRGATSTRGSRVCLVIPTAVSPKSLGISADLRQLGVAVTSVTLAAA